MIKSDALIPRTTSARLAFALLGYITLIILLLTLNPFYLVPPEQIRFALRTSPDDAISNVILFLPIGFLYRLTTRRRGGMLLGALISAGIEIIQLFIPARTPSVWDFINNMLGAGLGVLIHDLLASRISLTPGLVGRLRIETPLMSFVYLLIPLLWIDGFAMNDSPSRWMLTGLIGICGAIVFSDVYRYWLGSTGIRVTVYASLTTGVWFLLGAGPNFPNLIPVLWIDIFVMLTTAVLTILPRRFADRRFERATLQRLIPFFILYVLLLAIWSPDRPLVPWHGMLGFTDRIQDTSLQGIYPRIEYLVAFSILGYLMAEWRGRAELSMAKDFPHLLAMSGATAFVLELFAGFQAGMGASLVRAILVIASAFYGGVIYHFLRDHVRALLATQKT